MTVTTTLVAVALAVPPLTVVNAPDKQYGKGRAAAYEITPEQSLELDVVGPTALLLEVRGAEGTTEAKLTLVRNARWKSENSVALKQNKTGPAKGFTMLGRLGIDVPAGKHRIEVQATAGALVVQAKTGKKVPPPIAAAADVDMEASATAVSTPPAPESIAAATTPPATPPTTPPTTPAPAVVDAVAAAPVGDTKPAAPASGDTTAAFELESRRQLLADETEAEAARRQSAAMKHGAMVPPLRVAVYDYELQNVEPTVGSVVTDSMLSEVRKLSGVSVIGMDEIRDMLSHEANKQILGCSEDTACLAEIAGALGVDQLVSGQLLRVDNSMVFLTRRIDQRRAHVLGTVDRRLQASSGGEEVLAAVGPAVEELFPNRPLREGVTRGVPPDMALRLNPPPLPTWTVWTGAGAAVVAAAVGGVFRILAYKDEQSFKDTVDRAMNETQSGRALVDLGNSAERNALYSNGAFIGAGVFAVASGVMALFADWHGYAEQSKPR